MCVGDLYSRKDVKTLFSVEGGCTTVKHPRSSVQNKVHVLKQQARSRLAGRPSARSARIFEQYIIRSSSMGVISARTRPEHGPVFAHG